MRKLLIAGALLGVSLAAGETATEVCIETMHGSCQESLDWDYTTEKQQNDNEETCWKLAGKYCKDEITFKVYKKLVESIPSGEVEK